MNECELKYDSSIGESCCLSTSSLKYLIPTLWCLVHDSGKCEESLYKSYFRLTLFSADNSLIGKSNLLISLLNIVLELYRTCFESNLSEGISDLDEVKHWIVDIAM